MKMLKQLRYCTCTRPHNMLFTFYNSILRTKRHGGKYFNFNHSFLKKNFVTTSYKLVSTNVFLKLRYLRKNHRYIRGYSNDRLLGISHLIASDNFLSFVYSYIVYYIIYVHTHTHTHNL